MNLRPRKRTVALAVCAAVALTSLSGWEEWNSYDPGNKNKLNHVRLRRLAYANGSNSPQTWTDPGVYGPFQAI